MSEAVFGCNLNVRIPFEINRNVRTSLPEQVANGFRLAISSGHYKPGDVLPLREDIAKALGISVRIPREAIRIPERENLVSARRGVGCTVLARKDKLWKGRVVIVERAMCAGSYNAAMSLGVIDRRDYFRFAASFFRKAGRILPEETFTAAYDRFEGITWYVQSVMKALYASEVARPTEKDVIAAIAHLVEENAMNYGFILSKCSPGAVELLRAVAADRVVAEPMSAEFGRKYGLRAASSIRFALDSLLNDELLYKREDGYVVYDRLFAEWLRL